MGWTGSFGGLPFRGFTSVDQEIPSGLVKCYMLRKAKNAIRLDIKS